MDEIIEINDLPVEILVMIFRLIPECILRIRKVCLLWKNIEERHLTYEHPRQIKSPETVKKICSFFPRARNLKVYLEGDIFDIEDECKHIYQLRLRNMNTSGIFGLHKFTNLTHLVITRTSGVSMSYTNHIENLRKLTYLDMSGQGIIDVSGIANLINLTYLNLSESLISDITPLKNLTKLQELHLTNTSVEDVSAIGDLTNMIRLGLSRTMVVDISSISKLVKLELLDLSYTAVSDINIARNFSRLRTLFLDYTQVSDLSPLGSLSNLRHLNIINSGRYSRGMIVIIPVTEFTCLMETEGLSIMTHTGTFRIEGGKIHMF